MKRTAITLISFLLAPLLLAAQLNKPAPKFPALSNYKGKVVFINFWASWCAPCQAELPELNRLAADYRDRKVQVIAINVDEHRKDAKKSLAKLGLTTTHMKIVSDPKSKIVSAYNIESMPTSFILDQRGL